MDIALGITSFLGVFFVIYQSYCRRASYSIVSLSNNTIVDNASFNKYLQLGYSYDLIEVTYSNLNQLFGVIDTQNFCSNNGLKHFLENNDVKDLLIDICIDLDLDYPKNSEIYEFENQKGAINSFEMILDFVSYVMLKKN